MRQHKTPQTGTVGKPFIRPIGFSKNQKTKLRNLKRIKKKNEYYNLYIFAKITEK